MAERKKEGNLSPSLEPSTTGEQVDGGGVPWREGPREIETVKYVTRLHTAATPFHAIYIVAQLWPIHASWDGVRSWRAPCASAFIDVINTGAQFKGAPHHTDKFFAAMAREKWTGPSFDPNGFKKKLRSKFGIGSINFMERTTFRVKRWKWEGKKIFRFLKGKNPKK